MKKIIGKLTLVFITIIAFSYQTKAQNIAITNNMSVTVDVSICGTSYIAIPAAGGTAGGVSPCTLEPCSFTVDPDSTITPWTYNTSCGTTCPYTDVQSFPAQTSPFVPAFTVTYTYACSGDITIVIN